MPERFSFIAKYWQTFAGISFVIFAAGALHADNESTKSDVQVISARLEKKIKIISEMEDRLFELEKEQSFHDGYEQGLADARRQLLKKE